MCVCVCVYKILPCILIFIIFEGLFLLTQILMFFQRVCAGCILKLSQSKFREMCEVGLRGIIIRFHY